MDVMKGNTSQYISVDCRNKSLRPPSPCAHADITQTVTIPDSLGSGSEVDIGVALTSVYGACKYSSGFVLYCLRKRPTSLAFTLSQRVAQ